jgi:hypothetical protein
MVMTDKLKPCPFCGGEAGLIEVEDGHGGLSGAYVVCLNGCNVQATPITWNTRADDWQPIETAPKDGTEIMVWPVRGMKGKTFLEAYHDGTSWVWCSIHYGTTNEINPTHWKYLPEPPKTGDE